VVWRRTESNQDGIWRWEPETDWGVDDVKGYTERFMKRGGKDIRVAGRRREVED
jgi:hypothetical protein